MTGRFARASFPKGTLAMGLRDALGTIYQDEAFADLFPHKGAPQKLRGDWPWSRSCNSWKNYRPPSRGSGAWAD